ncbi:hypothetical protein [Pseudomonas phage pPA-3099-2aT.2]|uniref:Uncharacterized protein n=1 Tax=Pseudomonas phage pPA-3099-2aT.2 TaxID=3003808 RepID=A0AAE9W506_9CAUD|nr:hypothetical protein QE325_gp127 [Pseudomonas phage pPA-3099-2aT.2]WBQ35254.1 hypothetical protein [Pseudomonas phage pPA-3099-2aT.2]
MKLSERFSIGLKHALQSDCQWYMCIRLREAGVSAHEMGYIIGGIMRDAGMTAAGVVDGGVDDYFVVSGMADRYKMTAFEESAYGQPAYAMWVQFWFWVIFDLARKGQ